MSRCTPRFSTHRVMTLPRWSWGTRILARTIGSRISSGTAGAGRPGPDVGANVVGPRDPRGVSVTGGGQERARRGQMGCSATQAEAISLYARSDVGLVAEAYVGVLAARACPARR